jgi:hypothetical protein
MMIGKELIEVATKCGITVLKENRNQKIKKQICNKLREKYHTKPKIHPKLIRQGPTVRPRIRVEDKLGKYISNKKLITTSFGYCHDIDELVSYLIIVRNENVEPLDITKTTKIWKNEAEKATIISHPGLDLSIREQYNMMLERLTI